MANEYVFAGRYRVQSLLGQGGMGVVHLAVDVATGRPVALKRLWPHLLGSRSAEESFRREAFVAASLVNEHVVKVLDSGVDEFGVPYLAMERLRGKTLEELVASSGPFSVGELLTIMSQVGSALGQAHGHLGPDGRPAPIVHRDLKPENLFLTWRESGRVTLKVLDFGIAKVTTPNPWRTDQLRGTPLYMAPEQINDEPATSGIDVWALGLITFYLLTGRSYWLSANRPSRTPTRIFDEVLSQPIIAPRWRAHELGLEPSWPSAFDPWFLQCVNRAPRLRFATPVDAVAELHEALGSSPRRDACRLLSRLSNLLPARGSSPTPSTFGSCHCPT